MYDWMPWRSAAQALGHMHGVLSSSDQDQTFYSATTGTPNRREDV